jgi:hypothetical protein
VARALVVDAQHAAQLGWPAVAATAEHSLAYLEAAFDPRSGRFRNIRSDDGTWLDRPGSPDAHGRAMLALATLAAAPADRLSLRAAVVFERGLVAAERLTALRAMSSTIVGCALVTAPEANALSGPGRARAWSTLEALATQLRRAFPAARRAGATSGDASWPWPEPVVTYEAFLIPRALLAAGDRLAASRLFRLGRDTFDWLLDRLVDRDGRFHPVGNRGWWPRGGVPARFDQQPIEAGSLAAAADLVHSMTGDPRYVEAVDAAYAWFLGRNDGARQLALPRAGACCDGLGPRGVNRNRGAESTLAWLAAVEHVRAVRARTGGQRSDQRIGSLWPWGSGRGQDLTYARTAS